MATVHSGYEPESSHTPAARRNSESIELDTINQFCHEAQTSYNPKTHSATIQPDYIMEASTPRQTSIYDPNIELNAINPHDNEAGAAETEFSLPPVDTGKDAWLFLFSAFVLEVLVWGIFSLMPNSPIYHSTDTPLGFPFAYGIFQEYYSSNPPFEGERNIAIIGTCAMGLMYLSAPLVFGMLAWYPNSRRPCIMAGLIIMCLSLGLSSLSTTVPHLIASQGVFYAIGGALCYSPAITFMDEWFVKRKGLAFGMMWVSLDCDFVIIHPMQTRANTHLRQAQD